MSFLRTYFLLQYIMKCLVYAVPYLHILSSNNLLLDYYFLCIMYDNFLQVGLVCIRSLNLIMASNVINFFVINYVLFYPPTTHLLLIRKLGFMTPPTQFTSPQCLQIKLQFTYCWQVRGLVNTTLVYIRCLKKQSGLIPKSFSRKIYFVCSMQRGKFPQNTISPTQCTISVIQRKSLCHTIVQVEEAK